MSLEARRLWAETVARAQCRLAYFDHGPGDHRHDRAATSPAYQPQRPGHTATPALSITRSIPRQRLQSYPLQLLPGNGSPRTRPQPRHPGPHHQDQLKPNDTAPEQQKYPHSRAGVGAGSAEPRGVAGAAAMRPGGVWGPGEARAREKRRPGEVGAREKRGPRRSEGPGETTAGRSEGPGETRTQEKLCRQRERGRRESGARRIGARRWRGDRGRDSSGCSGRSGTRPAPGRRAGGWWGAWAGRGDAHMSGKC
jgi:hypothetical protein